MTSFLPPSSIAAIGAYYFFYFGVIGAYLVYLPKLLFESGFSAWHIGVIFAINPLMRFLSPFLFLRRLQLTSSLFVISVIISALLAVAHFWSVRDFWLLLINTIALGFCWSLQLPFVDAKAIRLLSRAVYGRVRILGSVGFIVSVLVLGKVPLTVAWVVGAIVVMAICASIAGVMLVDASDKMQDRVEGEGPSGLGGIGLSHWNFWISIVLMQVAFGAFYNFFTIYEANHGVSQETISWLWTAGVVAEIVMLGFQGPWMRFDLMALIKLSTALTVLRWLLLWLWPDRIGLVLLAQSLHAFSFALYHVATLAYLANIATKLRLAQQFYYGLAFGLGGFAGSILSGLFYGSNLFLYAALVAAAALMALYLPVRIKSL